MILKPGNKTRKGYQTQKELADGADVISDIFRCEEAGGLHLHYNAMVSPPNHFKANTKIHLKEIALKEEEKLQNSSE